MKKLILSTALAVALTCFGCALGNRNASHNKLMDSVAVAPYSADSLRNYKTARDFAAQGRYELAREHYLLALAATADPYLQDALAKEIESVDMFLKTLR